MGRGRAVLLRMGMRMALRRWGIRGQEIELIWIVWIRSNFLVFMNTWVFFPREEQEQESQWEGEWVLLRVEEEGLA